MSTESKVRFEQDGALGTLTLDSPPLNLIGDEVIADLLAAIDAVEQADGLRSLLLRGEGKVFSAGADVALFAGMGADEMRPLIDSFLDLGRRIEQLAAAEPLARRLADGPSRAYAVVKDLARAYTTDGVAGADALLLDAAVGLFDTDDARGGIRTFLESGPGKAAFAGP